MRTLLVALVLIGLLWVVTSRVLPLLQGTADESGEIRGVLDVGVSPFPVAVREQYLCLPVSGDRWRMLPRGGDGAELVRVQGGSVEVEECRGPFSDSISLCAALSEVGQTSVRLYHEGRMLDCRDS